MKRRTEIIPQLEPSRAMAHPLWFVAAVLMTLNDHVLKLLPDPRWLTGKLSDFTGMIVAPWIFAALLRVRDRRGVALAHLAVGFVFALINLHAPSAAMWDGLTALGPVAWKTFVDPTDLIALPMLLVSWKILLPIAERPAPVARWLRRAAVVTGGLACMANEPPIEPEPFPIGFQEFQAEVAIANNTPSPRVVRIRPLLEEVEVNCPDLMNDPSGIVSPELFAPATSFLVEARAMVALGGDQVSRLSPRSDSDCRVYLIDAAEAPLRLVVWPRNGFEPVFFTGDLGQAPTDRTLLINEDENGAALWNDEHPLIHPAPESGPFEASCGFGEGAGQLDYISPAPSGLQTITATASGPDGCHALELSERNGRWYFCIGSVPMPFSVGEAVEFGEARLADGALAQGFSITSTQGTQLTAARGKTVTYLDEGLRVDIAEESSDCPAVRDACGALAQPLAIQFNTGERLLGGETVSIAGGELTLLRAARYPVVHRACTPELSPRGRVMESIFVKNAEGQE